MTYDLIQPLPTRAAAHAALQQFVPLAGRAYAQQRNFDFGPGRHDSVSCLSPFVKQRLLDEIAVSRAVLEAHSRQDADKFLAEVFWRTYWKGWMELRPSVWLTYTSDLNRLRDDVQTQAGLHQRWEEACLGQTGIAPFDAWAQELVSTGYLHNHARMWFASIWIFTLELPWQLGADFFLRHLLDGDAAVNTLSWRWVAGLQTQGKTYLADAGNITKFTQGRFSDVTGLAPFAVPVEGPENPPPGVLPALPAGRVQGRYGVLLHEDDVDLTQMLAQAPEPAASAYLDATAGHSPWQMAPHVGAFRRAAARAEVPEDTEMATLKDAEAIAAWAASEALDMIVLPYAPIGPAADVLNTYAARPDAVAVLPMRRALDTVAWPLATKGFFPFRKHIAALLDRFV